MRDEDIPFGEPWLTDAAELLARGEPGPTPWLVQDMIVDKALTAVVGRWKTTKSYGLLDICIAIAVGRPAFGVLEIPERGPVVFVNEESGEAALWRRLDYLCRGRAITADDLRGKQLYVAANKRVKLDDETWQAQITADCLRIKPRLIVFDPLVRMKASERKENAQEDMAPLIEFMRVLRDEAECAVAFVQHTGHQGEHMRGASDLESVWETRLHWKRDKQSSEVAIHSEHREADAAAPFKYRIAWDGLTRSMRFEAVGDPFETWLHNYLIAHPEASANDVYKASEHAPNRPGRPRVLELVKEAREGGTETQYHPSTTPSDQRAGSGTAEGAFRPLGTTPTGAPFEVVPRAGTTPSQSELQDRPTGWLDGPPLIGDPGYLEHLYAALEKGLITEAEWHQGDKAHRFVVEGRA